ncbi:MULTISPECIES: M20/M25/M40 family metallo-hydrolase [unclassified Bradyrhizobium]|uniref:M20/M25/M40 family metallo-hydrolase n=1 Tax=unclassified Bradyrhizobium TaxID=2631580 RepID=UPI0024788B45|nr:MULTISPECIES: M20/M25/M40 family metallo-hydrolase [unclassified Bradyrhizobium]WGR69626.1 M20/M25/M40 family metallo-hydrolase [Bradyrhizobium sp. ISRA426]WGR81683.1 M20/M25/M40 family metallo-hydrolase [Bradyrhizobium sp. ISRA430]WGR84867.1 M20/M25/M40 family metallo-hydrolase [Bradyrhizobium sp. ISRA432]
MTRIGLVANESLRSNIRTYLESQRQAQTRFLAELVKVPSDNPPGDCVHHGERAAELLEELGFLVERHRVPETLVRSNGMISVTNLIVRRRFGDGPIVALNAHGDVVPPGEGWTRDPYGATVMEGWMYGRGAAVSKSDFATYAFALRALEVSGVPLAGTVELHFTYDEEAGGEIGPKWLLDQGLTKPDHAIAAGFSYAVVTAHNGCLHLEVTVHGRSAHAAMPYTGVDALEAANHVLAQLYEWRRSLRDRISAIPGIGSPQLTVGLISGGINTNVVPDRITFRLDRRMIPEEDPVTVEQELQELIAKAACAYPQAEVEVRRILLAEPLKPLPGTERLAQMLCGHASDVMGEPISSKGVPLYTDARHYAAAGVPIVLFGAGPRTIEEANAHRADERLPLPDLFKATEVVALTLVDLLRA